MKRRKPAGYGDLLVEQRTRRKRDENSDELFRTMPKSVRSATGTRTASEGFDSTSSSTSSLPNGPYTMPVEDPNLPWDFNDSMSYNSDIEPPIEALRFPPHTTQTDHGHFGPSHMFNDIPRGPSVIFNKDTWWDNLLQIYCEDPSQSAQKILQDVTFSYVNLIYTVPN